MTDDGTLPMMHPMMFLRKTIMVFAVLLLAACGGGNQGGVDYPPLAFTRYQPIYMAVSSIQIVEEYKSPNHAPYVEHLIPYSPTEAVHIWVRDRLRAGGGSKTMQIIIREGSVMSGGKAPSQDGGLVPFTSGDNRYDAKLEVELRIYDQGVISEASVFVTATRTMNLQSPAGPATRNAAFRKMIGDMMELFNADMEKNMFMYMANYISYSQNP